MADPNQNQQKETVKTNNRVSLGDIFNWDPKGALDSVFLGIIVPKMGELFVNSVEFLARYFVYGEGNYVSSKGTNGGNYVNYGKYSSSDRVVVSAKADNRADISRYVFSRPVAQNIYDDMLKRFDRYGVVRLFDFYDIASQYANGIQTETTDSKLGWIKWGRDTVKIQSCSDGYFIAAPKPSQLD